ncbi:MAG: hypothetical protein ACLP1X_32705 [Polyangiaceae bacterium]
MTEKDVVERAAHVVQGSAVAGILVEVRDATTPEQLDALLPDRWQPLGPAP